MLMPITLAKALLHGSLLFGAPATQNYRLTDYPDDGNGCVTAAADVGARFAAASQSQVTATRGYYVDTTKSCTVSIDYLAAAPVAVETTDTGSPLQGLYSSIDECQGDLANQERLFERYTRVKVGLAWCFHQVNLLVLGELDLSNSPVALHIEGYGHGVEHYMAEAIDLQSPYLTGVPAADDVGAALTAAGHAVVKVAVRSEIDDGAIGPIASSLQIRYYGPTPLTFNDVFVWNASDAACEGNLATLQSALAQAGAPPFLAYCSAAEEGISYGGTFVHFVDNGKVVIKDGSRKYPTIDACIGDEATAMSAVTADAGWRPLTAVCSVDWGGFTMTLVGTK